MIIDWSEKKTQGRFEKKLKLTPNYQCVLSVHFKLPADRSAGGLITIILRNLDCDCELLNRWEDDGRIDYLSARKCCKNGFGKELSDLFIGMMTRI